MAEPQQGPRAGKDARDCPAGHFRILAPNHASSSWAAGVCQTNHRSARLHSDFRAEPIEYATNVDVVFVRWIARGTRPQGLFEAVGVDRIIAPHRLRQGKPDSIGSPGYRGLRRACG